MFCCSFAFHNGRGIYFGYFFGTGGVFIVTLGDSCVGVRLGFQKGESVVWFCVACHTRTTQANLGMAFDELTALYIVCGCLLTIHHFPKDPWKMDSTRQWSYSIPEFGGIYSPKVFVLRDTETLGYPFLTTPFQVCQ